MLPEVLHSSLEEWLKKTIDANCTIISSRPSSGGSINEAFRISVSCGEYFIKFNNADRYPGMFEAEKLGLDFLAKNNTIHVPSVFTTGITPPYSFILMEFINQMAPVKDYWDTLASQLAAIHHIKADMYGLDFNNYIGSLKQNNYPVKDYYEFLISQRLQPLLQEARDTYLLSTTDVHHFDAFFKKLPELLPVEEPSLIHGDLWSGNLLVNNSGLPCLIDPAIYYGHRESDIAMTMLFGGFPDVFYGAYEHYYPLIKGWRTRIELHQLYPLLVHINLFGLSYSRQVQAIIKKF